VHDVRGALISRAWPTDRIAFGGDYNPEQWPREVWRDDVRLMAEAGVSFVTLGVFAWSWLEPEPGRFDTEWLDESMDLLHDHGIAVDLATGTASPPPWFSHRHPETLPVDHSGRTLWPGSRQTWCPSSPVFTEHAVALVEMLASRFHDHPALAMWHVSNEYACHNLPCYCDTCADAFRTWLQRRYGHLDALNDAWGTSFWSQRYGDWAEINPPRRTTAIPNPTQAVDYARFGSDTLLEQFLAEREVLARWTPDVPVTTNFMSMSMFRRLDYHRWAAHQDVISTDHYPLTHLDDPVAELAFAADLTRGFAGGRPWVLMEHAPSAVNWQPVNRAKGPGEMIRHSLIHVARGADALGFFQWRASRAGAEKFHSALVPHAGSESKVFAEACRLGRLAGALGEVVGSRVVADVAVLWDYEASWACQQPAHPSNAIEYADVAADVHAGLRAMAITADVVHPSADLSAYRLVIVPTLYTCRDDSAASVAAAAEAGATVLVTYFSGIVDEHDHIRLGGYPGAFRDLLGVRVEEFFPLAPQATVALSDGTSGTAWSELLQAVDAEVVTTFTEQPLAGVPAVTRRRVGAGAAWYVATRLSNTAWATLLNRLTAEAGVQPAAVVPAGIEAVRRACDERSWLFLINHTEADHEVTVDGTDLVDGVERTGTWTLPAGAVSVLRQPAYRN